MTEIKLRFLQPYRCIEVEPNRTTDSPDPAAAHQGRLSRILSPDKGVSDSAHSGFATREGSQSCEASQYKLEVIDR